MVYSCPAPLYYLVIIVELGNLLALVSIEDVHSSNQVPYPSACALFGRHRSKVEVSP